MGNYDNQGRISKQAFLYSSGILLAICIIAAFTRFWIRISIQRQFSMDDYFLVLGMCCLIASLSLLFYYIDDMMFIGALITGTAHINGDNSGSWKQRAFRYQEIVVIACILTWVAIISVKMSFLFLFKRLLGRMETMLVYWYFVLIFTLAISAYGFLVYILPCPYFYDERSFKCNQGTKADLTFKYSMPQMILDVFSDILILAIPVRLLWQIRVRLSQKIAISSSLCLTIVIIAVTIIRASGIRHGNSIDSVWETYWQVISAEVGLIMTSATAFRTFFVARSAARQRQRDQNRVRHDWTARFCKIQMPSSVSLKTLRVSNSTDDTRDIERGIEGATLAESRG
ncbi:hypothetical protein BKA64DRAFT_716848 [Cadophora sp. MPI-SDFR-AT-0126]|nr:hypothetical protein BKA64DRAFT_716848 [Leotiomycetes sp. MPI-SDFR-AT-0126]